MTTARFRQADIRRAVNAARRAGLVVSGFEVATDGRIVVHAADAPDKLWVGDDADAALDEWRRQRGCRSCA